MGGGGTRALHNPFMTSCAKGWDFFASSKHMDFTENSPDLWGVHTNESLLAGLKWTLSRRAWRLFRSSISRVLSGLHHEKHHNHFWPSQTPLNAIEICLFVASLNSPNFIKIDTNTKKNRTLLSIYTKSLWKLVLISKCKWILVLTYTNVQEFWYQYQSNLHVTKWK